MEKTFSLTVASIIAGLLLAGCQAAEPGPAHYPAPVAPPTSLPATAGPPVETPTRIPTRTPLPTATTPPSLAPVTAPTDVPTADLCWQAGGRVTRHSLSTDLSPDPWDFRVYTPPCYDRHPERTYPLLILIHGANDTDSQWDDLGADETADELIASGLAPPFLILMPRDRLFVAPIRDPFGEALMSRILPWVDLHYRTIADREHRAIGGLSRGASWAVHLGLNHWQEFSAIGAHSLPLFLSDPPLIPGWLDLIPPEMLPRFYIDIGEDDHLLNQAAWFGDLLAELNIPHQWHLNTGRHEPAYWERHTWDYLVWYSSGW
ncbi:MAG TPA: alpha/beta hydrolase-fold protein [Anaerolineales bacterium]|nr:alpha/beta hydrolase-fold protein [Anaerolineales bacterium]